MYQEGVFKHSVIYMWCLTTIQGCTIFNKIRNPKSFLPMVYKLIQQTGLFPYLRILNVCHSSKLFPDDAIRLQYGSDPLSMLHSKILSRKPIRSYLLLLCSKCYPATFQWRPLLSRIMGGNFFILLQILNVASAVNLSTHQTNIVEQLRGLLQP